MLVRKGLVKEEGEVREREALPTHPPIHPPSHPPIHPPTHANHLLLLCTHPYITRTVAHSNRLVLLYLPNLPTHPPTHPPTQINGGGNARQAEQEEEEESKVPLSLLPTRLTDDYRLSQKWAALEDAYR